MFSASHLLSKFASVCMPGEIGFLQPQSGFKDHFLTEKAMSALRGHAKIDLMILIDLQAPRRQVIVAMVIESVSGYQARWWMRHTLRIATTVQTVLANNQVFMAKRVTTSYLELSLQKKKCG